MKILAIDPGLQCGYACVNVPNISHPDIEKLFDYGTWNLKGNRFEGAGFRYIRFKTYLEVLETNSKIDYVFYEEVHRHLGTDAAHCYGGIIAHLQVFCESRKIPYHGVPVQSIKKFATGKGNANKETMLQEAQRIWGPGVSNNDEADALFILQYACRRILKAK